MASNMMLGKNLPDGVIPPTITMGTVRVGGIFDDLSWLARIDTKDLEGVME